MVICGVGVGSKKKNLRVELDVKRLELMKSTNNSVIGVRYTRFFRGFSRKFVTLLKVTGGIVFLLFALWGIDWGDMIHAITSVDLFWLLLTFSCVLLGLVLKILRWYYLLKNFDVTVPFRRLAEAFFSGQAVNILLPVRGGEVARVGIILSEAPDTLVQVAVTIGLEKIIDLIFLSFLATSVFAYLPVESGTWVQRVLFPISGVATIGLMLAIFFAPKLWEIIEHKIPRKNDPLVDRFIRMVGKLVKGSLWLRDLRKIFSAIMFTIIIWIVMWVTNLALFQSFNLPINPLAGGLVLVFGYIKVLPVGMPGNLGTSYFLTELALKTFNVNLEIAAAYAIVLHALVTLPPLIFSGLFLLISGRAFKTRRIKSQS